MSNKGITADPSKVEAIRAFPAPTTLKEVQRFLGISRLVPTGFVPGFSKIVEAPQFSEKKGTEVLKWTTQCQQAFDQFFKSMPYLAPHSRPPRSSSSFHRIYRC